MNMLNAIDFSNIFFMYFLQQTWIWYLILFPLSAKCKMPSIL
jgi:hypothetical protein